MISIKSITKFETKVHYYLLSNLITGRQGDYTGEQTLPRVTMINVQKIITEV